MAEILAFLDITVKLSTSLLKSQKNRVFLEKNNVRAFTKKPVVFIKMPCHKRQPKTLSKAQWILPSISAKSVNRSGAHTKINLPWRKAKVFISQVISLLRLTFNSSELDDLV